MRKLCLGVLIEAQQGYRFEDIFRVLPLSKRAESKLQREGSEERMDRWTWPVNWNFGEDDEGLGKVWERKVKDSMG